MLVAYRPNSAAMRANQVQSQSYELGISLMYCQSPSAVMRDSRIVVPLLEINPLCPYCCQLSAGLHVVGLSGGKLTWKFFLKVLIVLVTEPIHTNQSSGLGIAYIDIPS